MAHRAVSQRPLIPLYTIVARSHMYTYTANVWDLSIIHGPFSVAPCQTLALRFICIAVCPTGRLDGSMTVDKRTKAIKTFEKPNDAGGPTVFLVSTKAGGTGLNLTCANLVSFGERYTVQGELFARPSPW
jgi:hypothetical protein